MKQIPFAIALAATLALTLASGAIQGNIRNRWGPSQDMLAAAQKLDDVPTVFGGARNDRWRMKSSESFAPDTLAMLECTGHLLRTYKNPRTGAIVHVFVIVGPAGPISAHTPELCMAAQNYTSRDKRERVTIAGGQEKDDQFWALSFKTKNVQEDLRRVYYGWTGSKRWTAPDGTRFGFVGLPYLYKIQVESDMKAGTNLKTSDACREFLKDFLPVIRPHLL